MSLKISLSVNNYTNLVSIRMLRHACGYKLANQGTNTRTIQGYLGHRNIRHTVRYTELAPRASRGCSIRVGAIDFREG